MGNKSGIPWTEEDSSYLVDHYGDQTLHQIAEHLGRTFEAIQVRSYKLIREKRLDPSKRFYHAPWSEDEEDYLRDSLGLLSDAAICKKLGRSRVAITLKAKRLGINRKMNLYTAREVGRIFGVDAKTVLGWQSRGWLVGKRTRVGCGGGKRRMWHFPDDELERFVDYHGWVYDWRRIDRNSYLFNRAKECHERDPWLTLEEVGAVLGWQKPRVARWLHRDFIPHKRRPKQAQYGPWQGLIVVQRSALAGVVERVAAQVHRNRSESARARMAVRLGRAA